MKRNKKILFMPFFMLFNDSLLMKIETFFAGLLMIYLIFYYYVDDSGQFFSLLAGFMIQFYYFWLIWPPHLFHGRVSYVLQSCWDTQFSNFFFENAIKLCEEVIKFETPQLSFFGSQGDKILFILNNFIILI